MKKLILVILSSIFLLKLDAYQSCSNLEGNALPEGSKCNITGIEGICYKQHCTVNCSTPNSDNSPCRNNNAVGSCYKGICYSINCDTLNEGSRCLYYSGGMNKEGTCKNGTCQVSTPTVITRDRG